MGCLRKGRGHAFGVVLHGSMAAEKRGDAASGAMSRTPTVLPSGSEVRAFERAAGQPDRVARTAAAAAA
jgi:hypothetical protein